MSSTRHLLSILVSLALISGISGHGGPVVTDEQVRSSAHPLHTFTWHWKEEMADDAQSHPTALTLHIRSPSHQRGLTNVDVDVDDSGITEYHFRNLWIEDRVFADDVKVTYVADTSLNNGSPHDAIVPSHYHLVGDSDAGDTIHVTMAALPLRPLSSLSSHHSVDDVHVHAVIYTRTHHLIQIDHHHRLDELLQGEGGGDDGQPSPGPNGHFSFHHGAPVGRTEMNDVASAATATATATAATDNDDDVNGSRSLLGVKKKPFKIRLKPFKDCWPGQEYAKNLYIGIAIDWPYYWRSQSRYDYKKANMLQRVGELIHDTNIVYGKQLNVFLRVSETIVANTPPPDNKDDKGAALSSSHPGWNEAVYNGYCEQFDTSDEKLDAFRKWMLGKTPRGAGIWHLITACHYSTGSVWSGGGQILGQAYVGRLCDRTHNVGFTAWDEARQWRWFAHEVGHQFGANHSFEKGQGSTGGIMDYGDGKYADTYMFLLYRRPELCDHISRVMATWRWPRNHRLMTNVCMDMRKPSKAATTTTAKDDDGYGATRHMSRDEIVKQTGLSIAASIDGGESTLPSSSSTVVSSSDDDDDDIWGFGGRR